MFLWFRWVGLNIWWFYRRVALSSTFSTITDVYAAELATFGNCYSTWPSKRSNYICSVRSCALSFVVLLSVTTNSAHPGRIMTSNWSIFLQCSEPFFNFVFFSLLSKEVLNSVLWYAYWCSMTASTNLEYIRMSMTPSFKAFELLRSWKCKLLSWFYFLSFFIYLKEPFWAKFCSMCDSSKCGSQKMSLFTWEGRTTVYWSV